MMKSAKFNLGDVVIHKKSGYRAVVIDIDPIFQASGHYNPQACKRAFATRQPWYRLLVDQHQQETYVEECHLEQDLNSTSVDNPNINLYLKKLKGQYSSRLPLH